MTVRRKSRVGGARAGAGRPSIGAGARSAVVKVLLTPAELGAVEAAAAELADEGDPVTPAVWLRDLALERLGCPPRIDRFRADRPASFDVAVPATSDNLRKETQMLNSHSRHLLYVEPTQPSSASPVVDEYTRRMTGALRAGHSDGQFYRGVHTCTSPGCGAVSSTCDYYLSSPDAVATALVTNSLAIHYLAYHRDEVSPEDLAKVAALPASPADPTDGELAGRYRPQVATAPLSPRTRRNFRLVEESRSVRGDVRITQQTYAVDDGTVIRQCLIDAPAFGERGRQRVSLGDLGAEAGWEDRAVARAIAEGVIPADASLHDAARSQAADR